MRVLLPLIALLAAMPAAAQIAPDPASEVPVTGRPSTEARDQARDQVMAMMEASAAGWNAGDIERFLAIYSDDPGTSFAGSDGVAYGKAGVRARYLKGYPGQFGPDATAATRSVLTFALENFRTIGPEHALLIARWKLVKPNGDTVQGMTSLLFRLELMGWKIIADHSS